MADEASGSGFAGGLKPPPAKRLRPAVPFSLIAFKIENIWEFIDKAIGGVGSSLRVQGAPIFLKPSQKLPYRPICPILKLKSEGWRELFETKAHGHSLWISWLQTGLQVK
ncbi:hypothetical protein ACLKA7_001205 [Drosophila subpalustris]